MKTSTVTMAMVVVALAFSSAASSKPFEKEAKTGSRIATDAAVEEMASADVRRAQQDYARCVITRRPDAAEKYLLGPVRIQPGDHGSKKIVAALSDSDCVVDASAKASGDYVQLRMPGDSLRYALADALIQRDYSAPPNNDFKALARLEQPTLDPSDYLPKAGEKATPERLAELQAAKVREIGRIYMSQLGECVVRLDPGKSHALLMTGPATVAERGAVREISPLLSECLPPDRTLSMGIAMVRGAIALNFYRLAKAAGLPVSPPLNRGVAK